MSQLIYNFDKAIMDFVQQNFHNPFTDFIFPPLTHLGEFGFIWIIICLLLFASKKYRRWGIAAGAALALTFITGDIILKNIIQRPRPFVDFPMVQLLIYKPTSFSCPSGHSSSAFSVATVLFFINKRLGVPALILATAIAFSRVFLFVHWPSDIIFGAALGIFFGLLTALIFKKKFALTNTTFNNSL